MAKRQWWVGLLLAWLVLLPGCSARLAPRLGNGEVSARRKADLPAGAPGADQDTGNAEALPVDGLRPLKDVIRVVQPSVVHVITATYYGRAQGSGFVVHNGVVLTNGHVVEGATEIVVRTSDGTMYAGRLLAHEKDSDLALIHVQALPNTIRVLPIADLSDIEQGDEVIAFGSPLGFEGSVTSGLVSALDRSVELAGGTLHHLIQTSAPIAPGNSGGPLVHRVTGYVIGINTLAAESVSNLGFAIPAADARDFIRRFTAKLP